ncbi:MAG: amino acid racemase [Candidatus Bathyarchaeota archaeon]|nr:MAG: amino acid racemase [Candidatus Bathyarchaeota archaeon]
MEEKIIGILGGMGPEATADLFYKIIRATPVEKDQDHIRTIIYSNPKVPDRTPAVLGTGENPVPEMLMAGKRLEEAGADFLIIPCNTAHHFIDELRESLRVSVLHMIEMTAEMVRREFPEVEKAGLIATDGTVDSRIYERFFSKSGINIRVPDEALQRRTMEAIYEHIKRGELREGRRIVLEVAESLMGRGAEMVICGCTEVSLVLKDGDIAVPVVDPMQVLAEKAVGIALGSLELPA